MRQCLEEGIEKHRWCRRREDRDLPLEVEVKALTVLLLVKDVPRIANMIAVLLLEMDVLMLGRRNEGSRRRGAKFEISNRAIGSGLGKEAWNKESSSSKSLDVYLMASVVRRKVMAGLEDE
jgi:hypothetical protein